MYSFSTGGRFVRKKRQSETEAETTGGTIHFYSLKGHLRHVRPYIRIFEGWLFHSADSCVYTFVYTHIYMKLQHPIKALRDRRSNSCIGSGSKYRVNRCGTREEKVDHSPWKVPRTTAIRIIQFLIYTRRVRFFGLQSTYAFVFFHALFLFLFLFIFFCFWWIACRDSCKWRVRPAASPAITNTNESRIIILPQFLQRCRHPQISAL